MRFGAIKTALHAGTAVGVLLWTGAALAQARSFDVPSEDAVKAIPEFARQAGIQIVAPADQLKGVKTPAVKGNLDVQAALRQLLGGTGIEIVSDDGQTIILKGAQKNAEAASGDEAAATGSIETVVVTGTLIRGVSPASPVIVLDRTAIDRSGYQTAGDVVRNLPESFGGGQNYTVVAAGGSQNISSASAASSANLRGLGSESTLTLVDGHRLAYDGLFDSVDVSMIPLGAVSRVEVVTDGASATYGADAVAGVVNFIMRHDYDGVEVGTTIGGTTDGGGFQQIYNGLAGTNWSGGNAILSYEHEQQGAINSADRPFVSPTIAGTTLIPSTDRDSFFGRVQQNLTSAVSLFAEGLYTSRNADSALNDSTLLPGLTETEKASVQQFGFVGGVDADLGGSWSLDGAATIARDQSKTPEQAFLSGHLFESIGSAYGNHMELFSINASGPLFTTAAGDAELALGGEFRHEGFTSTAEAGSPEISATRQVYSAFGELQVPIVAPSDDRVGLEALTLDVAGRFEHYSDFGSTANPKVGATYKPIADLTLRSTWSTSFRAPSLLQEFDPLQEDLQFVPNATPPGGVAIILSSFGGSGNLGPEKSASTTFGADYTPHWLPGFKVSADYFSIDYRDRIEIPIVNIGTALTDPEFSQFVTHSPSAAMLNAAIAQAAIFNNLTGAAYNPATVTAFVNDQYQNFARQNAQGVDILADYLLQTPSGNFDFNLNTAYLNLTQRFLASSPQDTLTGTLFNPPSLRIRAGASWAFEGWDVAAFLNYTGSSKDIDTTPSIAIGSWTTVDTRISYRFDDDAFLSGSSIALIVNNLFDRAPPLVPSSATTTPGLNYDSTNASALGRFIGFSVSKKW